VCVGEEEQPPVKPIVLNCGRPRYQQKVPGTQELVTLTPTRPGKSL
jgi:hypothetical protein